MVTTRLVVSGLVQGVGYRQWMCAEAGRLGLRGWVRNRRDGTVEAIVEGDEAAVAQLVEHAHRGPPAARVDKVQCEPSAEAGFNRFDWRPTA